MRRIGRRQMLMKSCIMRSKFLVRLQVNFIAPHEKIDLSVLLNSLSIVPQLRLFLSHTDLGWQRLDVVC